jgi:hypothetical protein
VPCAPGPGWPRWALGSTQPIFTPVTRRLRWLVVVAAAGGVAALVLVIPAARPFVLAFVAGLVVYAALGAVSLAVLRRRQARFGPCWLAAQAEALRMRRFDVLRFTTSEPVRTVEGLRTVRRMYDLSRPDEVDRLLAVRDRAAADHLPVPVAVEFGYPNGDTVGVEHVRAELGSLRLVPRPGTGTSVRVRFPAARYGMRPEAEPPTTYWVLGEPNLTVTRSSPDRLAARPASGGQVPGR